MEQGRAEAIFCNGECAGWTAPTKALLDILTVSCKERVEDPAHLVIITPKEHGEKDEAISRKAELRALRDGLRPIHIDDVLGGLRAD